MENNNGNSNMYLFLRYTIVMVMIVFIANLLVITKTGMPFRDVQYTVCFMSMAVYYVYYCMTNRNQPSLAINTLLLCINIFITTIFAYIDRPLDTLLNVIMSALWWGMALMTSYVMSLKCDDAVRKSMFITAFIPLLFVLYENAADYIRTTDDVAMVSSAYYLLCLLPFVFLLKGKKYRYMCIALVALALMNSSKRTGFIAFLVAIFVYMFVKNKLENKNIFAFLRTAMAFALLYMLIVYFVDYFDFGILEKMGRLSEDQGSGRLDIYKNTWDMFINLNIENMIFGKGFNQVYYDSTRALSAHTDFLEVLYDYGIVGFILYMNMYRIFLKYAIRLYKEQSEYAPAFFSALAIMVGLSATSHLMIYDTYFIFLCMFFGLIIGNIDRETEAKLIEQGKYNNTRI